MRDFTDITILLDRSGSMQIVKPGTIEGVNAFIDDQKKVPGDGCWTLIQFDEPGSAKGAGEQFPHIVYQAAHQSAVPMLNSETFNPRGGTALIDAACLAIDATGRRLASLPEHLRPNRVLFVIVTDGEENSSRTYSRTNLNERIAHQQERYGWRFHYLGANQDSFANAKSFGVSQFFGGIAMNWEHTSGGILKAMNSTSGNTRNWKAEGTGGQFVNSAEPDKVLAK